MEIDVKKNIKYPEIARYQCYRAFLQDFFSYKKSLRAGFSYRQFANLVGLKSPNYLQLVIQGKRNLTEVTAKKIARALKLSQPEIGYFECLVKLANSSDEGEKHKVQKQLYANLKKLLTHFVEDDAREILEKWYYLLIREMVILSDFEASGEYISSRLQGMITRAEAENAFKLLLRHGYLQFDGFRYSQMDPVLDTGLDIFNHSAMQEYHATMMKQWASNIEKLGYENQELGVLNIPLPREKLPELQEKIRQFQDEIIGWCQDFSGNDELVQVGTYLMHYSKR